MSTENLLSFLRQAPFPSEARIREAGTLENFVSEVVRDGAAQGFIFDESEVLRFIEATRSTSHRELSDEQLDAVSGGEVVLKVEFKAPKTMSELYQDWADLGNTLKYVYRL